MSKLDCNQLLIRLFAATATAETKAQPSDVLCTSLDWPVSVWVMGQHLLMFFSFLGC
jgi:hypothetical protein